MRAGQDEQALVERERELAVLDGFVDALAAGDGGAVLVEGIAGIGKTQLLRAVANRAVDAGITPLDARGSELERDFTFGVVRQLLERAVLAARPARRVRLFDGSAEPAAGLLLDRPKVDGPDAGDGSFAALHGLYWVLANLAEDGPYLLVVDDLQWADEASQRFAAFVAGRLGGLPVGLVGAVRTGEGVLADPVLTLERQPDTEVLRPAALSPDGVRQLVEHSLGSTDPAFVTACAEATGGVPFYARELVTELARDGVEPTAANTRRIAGIRPESVARSVVARIAHLPGDAVPVAHALAVLGDATNETVVGALARVDGVDTHRAISEMRSVGVLAADRLTFAHPIMGGAVYADMPDAIRAEAHGRAAHLLREVGDNVERVSAHLLRAPVGTCEWGVEALRSAARAALDHGGAEEAIALLKRALAETSSPEARAESTFELGTAEWHAGVPDAVDHLQFACDAGANTPWWPQAVLFLARALMVHGRLDDAARVVDAATDQLADASPGLAARVTMEFFIAARPSRDHHTLAMERLPALERLVGGFDTPQGRLLLGGMAMDAVMGNQPAADVAERARRAWGAGDLLAVEPPGSLFYWPVVHSRICADDLDGAEDALQLLLKESRQRGSATGFAMARVLRAILGLRRGTILEAEADASEALTLARDHFPLGYPAAVGLAVEALVERGELDAADELLAANEIPPTLVVPGVHDFYLSGRARLRLARRQWSAARDDLLAASRSLIPWGCVAPAVFPWRSRAARASAALGDHEEAWRLVEEEMELAETFGSPHTLGVALQAAGQIAGGTQRQECFARAVELLDGTPFELESARALVGLGVDLRRAGDTNGARDRLRSGLDLALRCGAAPIAERARQDLVASGARPRRSTVTGVDALTATERRICSLAARGLTNRDIAQELFVAVKTVEVHLTNSYRKLAITSRAQLQAALEEAP